MDAEGYGGHSAVEMFSHLTTERQHMEQQEARQQQREVVQHEARKQQREER